MIFTYDYIRKIILWALVNAASFDEFVEKVKALAAFVQDKLATFPLPQQSFGASPVIEMEPTKSGLWVMVQNDIEIQALIASQSEGYGALDGSRLRKIVDFISDHPELIALLRLFVGI